MGVLRTVTGFVRKRKLLTAAIVVLGGGATAFFMLQMPSLGLADMGDWGEVTEDSVEVVTSAWVYNPNTFGVSLGDLKVDYTLLLADVTVAEGMKEGLQIEEEANNTIEVSTWLLPDRLPQFWSAHVRQDERSRAAVRGGVSIATGIGDFSVDGLEFGKTIETDIIGMMESALEQLEGNYSYEATGLDVADPEIQVREVSAEWGDVSEAETQIRMMFSIHNPNTYPIPAPEFVGEIGMNGLETAVWQANDVAVLQEPSDGMIAPGETQDVVLAVDLRNGKMAEWLVSHIERGEQTDAEVKVGLGFSVGGQSFRIPHEGGVVCGYSFQTGILVDDQEFDEEEEGCRFEAIGLRTGSMSDGGNDTGSTLDGTTDTLNETLDADSSTGGADGNDSSDSDDTVLNLP